MEQAEVCIRVKTKWNFWLTITEYLRRSLKLKKVKHNKSHATTIRSHCFECQNPANFEDFKIIGAASKVFEFSQVFPMLF